MSNNKSNGPSHYEQARSYAKEGLHKSTSKLGEIMSSGDHPSDMKDAAIQWGPAVGAGGKDFGKAGYHAGMGFMQGVSQQNPNSGQQLNNMKINQSIAEGNRGISSFQSKVSEQSSASKSGSTNKGIASFQSKSSGQTVNASKGNSSGQSSSSGQGR